MSDLNDWVHTSDLILNRETLADLLERASDPPAKLAHLDPDQDPAEALADYLSHGSGPVWGVMLPEHPETVGGEDERPAHGVVTCWTGNGPASEANARLYAAAPYIARQLMVGWDVAESLREDARHLRARAEAAEQARDAATTELALVRQDRDDLLDLLAQVWSSTADMPLTDATGPAMAAVCTRLVRAGRLDADMKLVCMPAGGPDVDG